MKCSSVETLLSLGSNLGDRLAALQKAVQFLQISVFENSAKSSFVFETEPVGFKDQPFFFNISLIGKTFLSPHELLQKCKEIEKQLSRQKRIRWHEREIDIDVLLYGDAVINDNQLVLPHPHIQERRFVLFPAVEIAPNFRHPLFDKTMQELAIVCPDTSKIKRLFPLFEK